MTRTHAISSSDHRLTYPRSGVPASAQEQYARFLECGPGAWDDKDNPEDYAEGPDPDYNEGDYGD